MKYLLDTNSWIEVLNKPNGAVAAKVKSQLPADVALCSVVLGELLVGAYKSSQPAANRGTVHQLVQQFACLPFDEASADPYARTRHHLEKLGQVPGLAVEDWQVP